MSHNFHFESLLSDPHLHASWSLRDDAHKPHERGQGAGGNRMVYDPEMDAGKITFAAGDGEGAADLRGYLRLPFPELRKGVDQEASFQWEARWGKEFLNTREDGLYEHKAFRLEHRGQSGEKRKFDIEADYRQGTDDTVALTTVRTYFGNVGGDGETNPITSGGRSDYQPGGESEYFRTAPDTWTRFTLSVTWHDGEQRIRLWVADENRDPVLVIADPDDPSKGFLADAGPEGLVGLDHFIVLFDTSQSPVGRPEQDAWVRNIVVFKDATVPLGGRPGAEISEPGEPDEPDPEPGEPPVEETIELTVPVPVTTTVPVIVTATVTVPEGVELTPEAVEAVRDELSRRLSGQDEETN